MKSIIQSFFYQNKEYFYTLILDHYKTVRIRVKKDIGIEIKMPQTYPIQYAEKALLSHIDWIQEKLLFLDEYQKQMPKTEKEEVFCFGSAFSVIPITKKIASMEKISFIATPLYFNPTLLFDKAIEILQTSSTFIRLSSTKLFVECKNEKDLLQKLNTWRIKTAEKFLAYYYAMLWEVFAEKMQIYAHRLGIKTFYHSKKPSLQIRNSKHVFGSCKISRKEKTCSIMLSRQLMGFPLEYIEFVILHEFCHLIYPNHSPNFYALFDLLLPNHKILRQAIYQWTKNHHSF